MASAACPHDDETGIIRLVGQHGRRTPFDNDFVDRKAGVLPLDGLSRFGHVLGRGDADSRGHLLAPLFVGDIEATPVFDWRRLPGADHSE
ncbi:MAG: hypothetical protein WA962_10220 [Ornithinimicrobium sp.]